MQNYLQNRAIASTSSGSTSIPADPTTSGREKETACKFYKDNMDKNGKGAIFNICRVIVFASFSSPAKKA